MRTVWWHDHILPRRIVYRSMGAGGWISDNFRHRAVVLLMSHGVEIAVESCITYVASYCLTGSLRKL